MNNPYNTYNTVHEFYAHVDACSGSVDMDRVHDTIVALTEARAEVERLCGLLLTLPPRAPDGDGLPRYGLRWNGPTEPLPVLMGDGYWTPWHLADAALRTVAERQREACAREAEGVAARGHGMDADEAGTRDACVDAVRATPLVTDEAKEKP